MMTIDALSPIGLRRKAEHALRRSGKATHARQRVARPALAIAGVDAGTTAGSAAISSAVVDMIHMQRGAMSFTGSSDAHKNCTPPTTWANFSSDAVNGAASEARVGRCVYHLAPASACRLPRVEIGCDCQSSAVVAVGACGTCLT